MRRGVLIGSYDYCIVSESCYSGVLGGGDVSHAKEV